MKCIACGLNAQTTAELTGIEASFCCYHAPFGSAKIRMLAVC